MNEIKINNTNGMLTVSSLQVARDFGKQHNNIVRDIETIISTISSEISETKNQGGVLNFEHTPMENLKFNVSDYFIQTTYQHSQNKQWYKCYDITRDGFALLVMGFTGKKALVWKLRYIEAFNSMERQLQNINSNIREIVNEAVTEAVSETAKSLVPYFDTLNKMLHSLFRYLLK